MKLTSSRLKEVLKYEPSTGKFIRIVRTSNRIRAGDIAGGIRHSGYWEIRVDWVQYSAHRLAWLYMTGQWPEAGIDHLNGNKTDNRWENLREATPCVNAQNERKARKNNSTGFLGVSRKGRRYQAKIQVRGRQHILGRFDTPEQAGQAYLKAKRELHEGCTI